MNEDEGRAIRIGTTWRDSVPEPASARTKPGRPNVLIVLLDDVGFSDLGCYGSEIPTPALDRLATEGLAYSEFHVTAMCSPTRAAMLTGRNAHAVGMGIISEWSVGFPGYRGYVTPHAATLAEVLGDEGYATYLVGKWHLTPKRDISPSGPFRHWPLGRGFQRWYGFHTSFADHWRPDLVEDNRFLDAPSGDGYFLTTDMTDRTIGMLRDHASSAPDRPFFMLWAPGACHWPHHAPAGVMERFRGRYDGGWDGVREARLARQIELGVVPLDTRLPPPNPDVLPWSDLTADQRRFAARLQEAYAAFMAHTDAELGRVLAELDALGIADDTLVIALSDNGASPEGGAVGTFDNRKHRLYAPEEDAERIGNLDAVGSEAAFNHYPLGWAQASNTPLKWYKKDTHGGGVRSPLIVRWPRGLEGATGWRRQFHHVVDVAATVLEAAGATMPETRAGAPQLPMDGVGMAYSFHDPDAPSRRPHQYFELFGDRAIWRDGWKAVTHHDPGSDFDKDRWELYHLPTDFAEVHDRASERPDVLEALRSLWWREAKRNDVLPLDDREAERIAGMAEPPPDRPLRFYPATSPISRMALPDMGGPWVLSAEVDMADGAHGVILAMGGRFAGFTLFLDGEGRACFDYRFSHEETYDLTGPALAPGRRRIEVAFGHEASATGGGQSGKDGTTWSASLRIDGRDGGRMDVPRRWPGVALLGALHCGRDPGAPVSARYASPNPCTAAIAHAEIAFSSDVSPDAAVTAREALDAQ